MACLFTQTRLDGTDLDIAAGLPGRPHAPAPVSNTVQPLRSPHPGAAKRPACGVERHSELAAVCVGCGE
jgi:hypothetical protein